jgi:dTDP-4-dehydrorhamnose reductase
MSSSLLEATVVLANHTREHGKNPREHYNSARLDLIEGGMMRVIVLGAAGMLGHKLVQRLRTDFEVAGTIREREPGAELRQSLPRIKLYPEVAANNLPSLGRAIDEWRPEVVLNCIGIVKQASAASDPLLSITINSLFPHQLAQVSAAHGARLIHFSTDCVFSGRHGNYVEDDVPDPVDLYGRSKLLGELATTPGTLTLRMSIVGRELRGHLGLIDWFLSQRGRQVSGYANALYTGLTTIATADLIAWLLRAHPKLEGLWHVSGESISKFDLLRTLNRIYGLGIEIMRDESFFCDRRLDSSRFRRRTGWNPLGWEQMINAMYSDEDSYARLAKLSL